jgi:hypothetical protein
MAGKTSPLDDETFERKERVLQAYYARLNEIDANNRDLTNFFFAVNTAIMAVMFQIVKEDWQRLVLAVVGYFASVALALIGYKSFWAWRAYTKEMRRLEDELEYGISQEYEAQLRNNQAAQNVRVTLVRLRFNCLFLILWLLILGYLIFTIPVPWSISPPFLAVLLGVIIMIAIVLLPWAYLIGTLRPIWAVLRVSWAREV